MSEEQKKSIPAAPQTSGFRIGAGNPDTMRLYNALTRLNEKVDVLIGNTERAKSLQYYLWEEAGRDTAQYMQSLSRYHGKYVAAFRDNKCPIWDETIQHIDVAPGSYGMEFGVYSGRSINYFAHRVGMPLYGFDSFEGLPESDGIWGERMFALDEMPRVPPHVTLVKGWFDESLPKFIKENDLSNRRLAYLHIDCDLYSSTVTILENLAPYIQVGTVILFDEYWNYPGWRDGEFKAWNEFVTRTGLEYEHLTYDNHEQLAIKITARP